MITTMPDRRVYSRQYKTDRWNLSNRKITVAGHDVLSALNKSEPVHERHKKVRWWLVEDAYGYLHEVKLDGATFSLLTS